jgi:hypothetical protein
MEEIKSYHLDNQKDIFEVIPGSLSGSWISRALLGPIGCILRTDITIRALPGAFL